MAETVYVSEANNFESYLSRPDGEAKAAVIVIHEVWGLNDHTKDIADRLAGEGYVALAPDLLSLWVDTDALKALQVDMFDSEKRNEVQPKMRELMAPMQSPEFAVKTVDSLKSCFDYLKAIPATRQKVFVMGYCFGGSYSFSLAIEEPELKGAVAYYGHADQDVDRLRRIKCPVQAFYGENDERLMAALPALKERMEEAGVDFKAKVYPDCGHAFFNDTNEHAYNEAAARDSWAITLEFFSGNL